MDQVHFLGHAAPGLLISLLGIYSFVQCCRRYNQFARKGLEYVTVLTYPIHTRCGRIPVDGCLKLLGFVEILGEIVTGLRPNPGPMTMETNAQHSTMSSAMVLSGIVDILIHFKVQLPPKSDYLAYINAIFIQGILFKFHLHGRDEINSLFHILLIYVIWLQCLVLVLEIVKPNVVIFPFLRSALLILEATWFFQVAVSLYTGDPGTRDVDSYRMWIVIYFAWHLISILITCLITFVLCRRFGYRTQTPRNNARYEMLTEPILQVTESDTAELET